MYDSNLYGKAVGVGERGRHKTTASALDAALKELLLEKNPFFDLVCDNWARMYPGLPAKPGRYEGGRIYLYVGNAPTLFAMRPKLRLIAADLAKMPGAPKKLDLRLEIHTS